MPTPFKFEIYLIFMFNFFFNLLTGKVNLKVSIILFLFWACKPPPWGINIETGIFVSWYIYVICECVISVFVFVVLLAALVQALTQWLFSPVLLPPLLANRCNIELAVRIENGFYMTIHSDSIHLTFLNFIFWVTWSFFLTFHSSSLSFDHTAYKNYHIQFIGHGTTIINSYNTQ